MTNNGRADGYRITHDQLVRMKLKLIVADIIIAEEPPTDDESGDQGTDGHSFSFIKLEEIYHILHDVQQHPF